MRVYENRIFLKSAARDFKRTGAVAPSSRALGSAMTSELHLHPSGKVRVLEVGGGTGNITEVIARNIRPGDTLDVFEIDKEFSDVIKRRVQHEKSFQRVRSSIKVHNQPIQLIDRRSRYDFIISCLPFTCFEAATVREIFELYRDLLNPGGVCTFFEYILVRKAARFMTGKVSERRRIIAVEQVVAEYVDKYSYRRDLVFLNIPPALVHHIGFTRS